MKILIIKISSLGDVVHTFALVNALRAKRPDITIDWLVSEAYVNLVGSLEGVRRVLLFKRSLWGEKWWSNATHMDVFSLISDIRAEHYDICLDLQGLLRSGMITLFSGAEKRAGLSGAREGSAYCYNATIETGKAEHAVEKLLKTLSLFDVSEPEQPSLEFQIPENEAASAKEIIRSLGVSGEYVVFHTGARWYTKMWKDENWRKLAENVCGKTGLPILFTGSSDDAEMIKGITTNLSGAYSIAGKGGLLELSAILRGAKLMVTVDSGPMHIAAAFGTPTVALFGPTSPKKTGPRTTGAVEIIQSNIDCVPCFDRWCERDEECMAEITPSAVEGRVIKILGG